MVFWKRKYGILREKAVFIGNIVQGLCTMRDKSWHKKAFFQ